ncbi:MFS transporter [Allokutzneria albata]|uniref:Predicted arabinose efflux permease, MFS family n=1 Tax=Allokutzneria albata TaxID=211114 RepID=A0A1H0CSM5_ALLAB|nr:MFS transporter [Allokutzneria albata]SDN60907.1 Predicted arabinose efflux permease, MFS family [Allokutzneria albata]
MTGGVQQGLSAPPAVVAVQRRVLGTLTTSQVLGGVGVATGVTVSSLAAASLSGSEVVGGLAQTSVVAGAALLSLPAARLAERRGRRPALIMGYGLAAAGAALAATAIALGAWPLLLAALVLVGGGSTANLAARYAATDLAAPDRRARSLSLVVWATTIGSVAGPNLAEPAQRLAASIGIAERSGPFLVSVLGFGAAAAWVWFGLRPDPLVLARSAEPGAEGVSCPAHGAPLRWTGRLAKLHPMGWLALVGIVLCHTAMVGLMTMTPVHMDHGGASLSLVGVVISLHIAGMYAASPVFGWMADRWGRVPVLALGAGLVVAAAGVAGTAASQDAPQLAVGLVLLGFGWSAGVVSGSALLTESVPLADRPVLQGMSDLAMNVGGALGGLTAGLVVTVWSYRVLGLVVGVLALPFLVFCLFSAFGSGGTRSGRRRSRRRGRPR